MFVYGTLLIEAVWMNLIGRIPQRSTAILEHYHRYQVLHEWYPGMWHEQNAQVLGAWIMDLNQAEIECVDHYEGHEYEKHWVDIKVGTQIHRTQTYARPPVNLEEWQQVYHMPDPSDPLPW